MLLRQLLVCHEMLLRPRQPWKQILFSPTVSRQFDQLHQLSENRQCIHSVSKYHNQIRTQNFPRLSLLRLHAVAGMASEASTPQHTNRLVTERSPYLLQHAHNPVDWYPWGPEAFEKAQAENKPIFLSIGYSTCHWCHVMERESFENDGVAKVLRENYVAIKLDREERPDIDKIYMSYVQKITGNGGWPLTLFLTPTLEPMYGGTYFPVRDNFGKIGLQSLLELIARQWKTQHNTLKREAKFSIDLVQAQVFTKLSAKSRDLPGEICWKKCFVQMNRSFEPIYGGFTESPKFPQPSLINFLLHTYKLRQATYEGQKALEMALLTLRRIGQGGIHDHVGSGFARYSVDGQWHVPHFEKMLYDQSQLALVYTDAYLITKDVFFRDMVEDIFEYVSRDLCHKDGGFYGAEDADSFASNEAEAKTEGAFYVWTMNELRDILTDAAELAIFCFHFGVKEDGNVDPKIDLHNELSNKNVLCSFGTFEDTAAEFDRPVEEIKETIKKCLEILCIEREKRPRPSTDTKIVTAWNGLMIAAFAKAGFAFNNEAHTERAIKAAKFVKKNLTTEDGSLFRCCYGYGDDIQQVDHPIVGLLEDYAFMIRGLIYLYQATLDGVWLEWAEQLQEIQNAKFWDDEYGSYFQSHGDDKYAIIRDKEEQDGAEPCGNSVAVHNLIRLDQYLDRKDFRDYAEQTLKGYSAHLKELPITLPEMITALMVFHSSAYQIFIAGKRDAQNTAALIDVVRGEYLPGHLLVLADGATGPSRLLYERNLVLENIHPVRGKAAAYVCKEFACTLPVTSPSELLKDLTKKRGLRGYSGNGNSSDSD